MKASLSFWKNLMPNNLLSRAAGVAAFTLLAGSVYAMPQREPDADSAQQGRWNAVYQAGAARWGLGSHVQVAIAKDQLILAGKKAAPFSIPASAITAVSSNFTSEHTVTRSQVAAWGGLAQFNPYTLIFLPFGIPVMAATYPIKSKYAYISVLWSEKGTDQEVQFRLDRKDYDAFLKQLQKSTGKEWKNLESEWERLRQALAAGTDHPIPFRLDRKVRMGNVEVKPGSYQLIILAGAGNQGDGYLFSSDQVNMDHLISTSRVEIAASSNDGQANDVIYKQDDSGVSRISEVRSSGQVFRFP
jgi:hypothetical protein